MKPPRNNFPARGARALFVLLLVCALFFCGRPAHVPAQNVRIIRSGDMPPGVTMPPTPDSPPPSSSKPDAPNQGSGPWIPSQPLTSVNSTNVDGSKTNADDVQLSFQGANIDMVVQWIRETTGKSVVKHPQVQCQLTIASSKKISQREALNLIYSALALEGVTAMEFGKAIILVPEGKEPKISPELVSDSRKDVPEGRQRLVKVFTLKHVQAADIKDRLRTALSDKATIDVDERANQLVITDYNDNIRAVGDLIDALDTDKPEDVTVRVITLKNVPADDLMKAIGPLYQKRNGKTLKDTVEVTADEQSNSLLILSSEANFRAIQDFVASLDTEDAQDKIMKTFTLKNADAQDVAKQLQDLNQDQSVTTRYIYYYNAPSGKSGKKFNVVADRRRNAVIVQAPPGQMDAIEKMIEELDEPVDDGSLAPKIYTLKYVSAVDIEDVLNELFLKKTQQRSYWDYYYDDYSSQSTPDRDVGRLYGKVRITSEPYSNTIIVTANSRENLQVVEDMIRQLDVPSEAGESTFRVGLRFAKAPVVAKNLNILFAKNGSPALRGDNQNQQNQQNNNQQYVTQQTQQKPSDWTAFDLEQEAQEEGYYPWLGGQPDNLLRGGGGGGSSDRNQPRPVSDLVGRVRVVPDQRGNALMVSANVHFFPQIMKLINDLDEPSDQVLIEARVVEVSSDFLDKLGVRWSPDGSQSFSADDLDNAFLLHTTARYQKGFGGTTSINSPPAATAVAQALTSLRSGTLDSSISMDFLVQFLRKTADAAVLGDPQITIADNELGRLFVGQEVPRPDNTQVNQLGGQNTAITYKKAGVTLEVTPHINSSGDVQLRIHVESSALVPNLTVLGGPVFDSRQFRTDLTVKDGETRILGGIIQKQISDTLRKTPILGNIPGVGWAFKKKDTQTHEVELMVFLRPKIVRTPEDAKELENEIDRRTPLLKKWREQTLPKTPDPAVHR
jgi:general secretion pathway protein D